MSYTKRLFLSLILMAAAIAAVALTRAPTQASGTSSLVARYLPRYASAPNCVRTFQLYGDTGTGKVRFCSVVGTPGTWNDLVAGSFVAPGAITSSGLTQATNKLLGRGTASTGAIEEITLGTNLSFTGTTLNATGGPTMNASDGVIPYRSSATAFSDSPIAISSSVVNLGSSTVSGAGASEIVLQNEKAIRAEVAPGGSLRDLIRLNNLNQVEIDRIGSTSKFGGPVGIGGNPSDTLHVHGTSTFNAAMKVVPVAFASLPASPATGMIATVNDSNTNTWGATIAGGGANVVLAFFNGSNWTVAAK